MKCTQQPYKSCRREGGGGRCASTSAARTLNWGSAAKIDHILRHISYLLWKTSPFQRSLINWATTKNLHLRVQWVTHGSSIDICLSHLEMERKEGNAKYKQISFIFTSKLKNNNNRIPAVSAQTLRTWRSKCISVMKETICNAAQSSSLFVQDLAVCPAECMLMLKKTNYGRTSSSGGGDGGALEVKTWKAWLKLTIVKMSRLTNAMAGERELGYERRRRENECWNLTDNKEKVLTFPFVLCCLCSATT